jgi:hypothetical protein
MTFRPFSVFRTEDPPAHGKQLQFGSRGHVALALIEYLVQMTHTGTGHRDTEQTAAVSIHFPRLDGTHPEPLEFGEHRPYDGPLFLQ